MQHKWRQQNIFFDGSITSLNNKNHTNTNHKVKIEKDAKSLFPSKVFFVNSFHENVVLKRDISSHFLPLMYAEDESVEAFVHKKYPILGVMFHPERGFKDNS